MAAGTASELVSRLEGGPPWNHTERTEMAGQAVELARRAGQPLLEAAALLAQHRWRTPFAAPARALADLQRAELIFAAHEQSLSVIRCRIEQACALGDLGQEIAAIHEAEGTLLADGLHVDDRLHAHLTIAACHLHTGDIDASERQLSEGAQPFLLAGAHPALQARAKWRLGMVLMAGLIARHQPSMWLAFVGLPQQREPTRPLAHAMALMDEAQQFLPLGYPSGEIRLARFGGLALLGADDRAEPKLEALWQESLPNHPALAVRAQFMLGLVEHRKGFSLRALKVLDRGLAMAQAWDQLALARDISLHQSQIHEALGDTSNALAALKVHGHLLVRSLRHLRPPTVVVQPHGQELSTNEGRVPVHGAERLEPVCLQKAEQFIHERVGKRLRVSDVVVHCGVSRRTLETAFRSFRARSVTQSILIPQMAHAAHLLRHTQRKVADIARGAGYNSPSAFAKEFKAQFGVLPSQWRKQLLSGSSA